MPVTALPASETFETSDDAAHSGEARRGRTFAWTRTRGACDAMPAASSSTSTQVAAKQWRMRTPSSPAKRTKPAAASRDPVRGRSHDAHDERSLEHFAEDDERGAEHVIWRRSRPGRWTR